MMLKIRLNKKDTAEYKKVSKAMKKLRIYCPHNDSAIDALNRIQNRVITELKRRGETE